MQWPTILNVRHPKQPSSPLLEGCMPWLRRVLSGETTKHDPRQFFNMLAAAAELDGRREGAGVVRLGCPPKSETEPCFAVNQSIHLLYSSVGPTTVSGQDLSLCSWNQN